MKIAICDDDTLYLKYLYQLVKPLVSDAELQPIPPSVLQKQIHNRTLSYDIVITDIDMGNLNGIQLATEINKINSSCIIIFISNFIHYATEVYDVNHIYFVLKSEAAKRLPKALEKALAYVTERKTKLLRISYQKTDYLIPVQEIIYLEALGRYLFIHTQNQSYKCIHTLKEIATELSGYFVRCHNSYIINLSYVQAINKSKCELSNGIDLPISMTYAKPLRQAYLTYISDALN